MYELALQFINSLCFTYFPASGHLNGDICLWNAETSKLITKLISHRSGMNCLNQLFQTPNFMYQLTLQFITS